MNTQELNTKTVLELRKIAKENGIKLGAGVSKSDIVAKIAAAMSAEEPAEQPAAPVTPVPAAPETPAAPAAEEKPAQPQFRQAWTNPSAAAAPRYNAKPAYQAPAYPQRQGSWQQQRPTNRVPAPQNELPRTQTVRPPRYTPRFGPNAGEPVTAAPQQEDYRPQAYRMEAPRPAYTERPAYSAPERTSFQPERPFTEVSRTGYEQPSYDSQPGSPYENSYQRPSYPQRRDVPCYQPDANPNAAAELMAPADCADGSGVLELHPDGYGFLRAETCVPSSRDIYIAQAQVRRFALRSGDYITGKIRPQREGDKYAAMLYITAINGMAPEAAAPRPLFEELTPIYPTRRINLDAHGCQQLNDVRLIDLIAPLGFGQRAVAYCPPECAKTELFEHLAQVILQNHPDVKVFALLLDERPEDVTLFRDAVPGCTVAASMFGQSPENHLRVADLLFERLQRIVENGEDAVLLVNSLTKFAKLCPAAAAQQRGLMPGMVVPTSLYKAKRLFSGARCMREGGSLTVIATMAVETGNPVDDSIIAEFKDAATTEITFDRAVARAGVSPAFNLQKCQTRRFELLLGENGCDGINHIRRILGTTPSAQAIPQLLSMMDRAGSNEEFMARIGDWAAQMEKSR